MARAICAAVLLAALVGYAAAECRSITDDEKDDMSSCAFIDYAVAFGVDGPRVQDAQITEHSNSIKDGDCKFAARMWGCANALPRCSDTGSVAPCKSVCVDFYEKCGGDSAQCDNFPEPGDAQGCSDASTARASVGLIAVAMMALLGSRRGLILLVAVLALATAVRADAVCKSLPSQQDDFQSCGFIDYDVAYDDSDEVVTTDALITAITEEISVGDCKYSARIFLCAQAYPRCEEVAGIPVPKAVCRDTCTKMSDDCKGDNKYCDNDIVFPTDSDQCTSAGNVVAVRSLSSIAVVVACVMHLTGMSRSATVAVLLLAGLAAVQAAPPTPDCITLEATDDMNSCHYIDYNIVGFGTNPLVPLLADAQITAFTRQLPAKCKYAARLWGCANAYPLCDKVLDIPVPRPVCTSVCEDYVSECGGDADACNAGNPVTDDCTSAGFVVRASFAAVVFAAVAALLL